MKLMEFKKLSSSTLSLVVLTLGLSLAVTGCGAKKAGSSAKGADSSGTYGEYGSGATDKGGIGLGTLERVNFDFDQSGITSTARNILEKNAKTIKGNSKMRILVEGHCDERGSNEYNIALGERRSQAVIDYLVNLGVQRSRLEMKSWGEERPLNPATNESAYQMNRRAEFVVLAK